MDSRVNIEKMIAKEKVISVIKSCVSFEHYINAKTYLELFFNRFNDKEAYDDLSDFWKTSFEKTN